MNAKSGNALFLILLALVVFAALSYSVTSSKQAGQSGSKISEAKKHASRILQYAQQLEEAVTKVRITKGCRDTQLSFERSPFDGSDPYYVNPNAPDNKACHIFHPNGGNVPYVDLADADEKLLTTNVPSTVFQTHRNIARVGTTENHPDTAELFYVISHVSLETCLAINKKVGVQNPSGHPPAAESSALASIEFAVSGGSGFKGSYSLSRQMAGVFTGKRTACLQAYGSDEYQVYHILVVR